jgi:hypothetical protein
MERYYFKTKGQEPDVWCTERCMVKNDGTMLGSVKCQQCEHNLDNDWDELENITWIKCAKIKEAIMIIK